MRSPNNWLASLIEGVSPHPEQAPENSNKGINNCEFLIAARFNSVASTSDRERKNSQFVFSRSRIGGCSAILIAFRPTCRLSLTGHASMHNLQPVQSSGDTCRVYFMPGNSL